MALHFVSFYGINPTSVFTNTPGSTFIWTGPTKATGQAVIDDRQTGIQGLTLEDDTTTIEDATGETATADVTIGGLYSNSSDVDAETVWSVRDTVTGEIFEVAQFQVENGAAAGFYTLSERPLVSGRTYEVLAYDTNPEAARGDIVFTYADFVQSNDIVTGGATDDTIDADYNGDPEGDKVDSGFGGGPGGMNDTIDALGGNDTVLAGAGDDIIYGGAGADSIDGGDGNDTIYADTSLAATGGQESLNWNLAGPDEASLTAGFTQNTGQMDVTVTFTNTGNNAPTFTVESTESTYVANGEVFDPDSSAVLQGNGDAATARVSLDFAAAGAGVLDEVENVTFRIDDIDEGTHRDVVTINAYDALGNPVPVTITTTGNDTIAGNTVTAGNGSDTPISSNGSVLIEIAGPVSSVDIIYSNAGSGNQLVHISDVHFDTVAAPGSFDDSLIGGAGDDLLFAGGGNDTLEGGTGNDTMSGGTGNDVFVLSDGSGADRILDFDIADDDLNGF